MKIISVCPESLAANTFLLISGTDAIVVDPAVSVSAIKKLLSKEKVSLSAIILTHGHFDHTIAVDTIRNKYAVPLMMHRDDAPMLADGKIDGFFTFYGLECTHRPAETFFSDGDRLTLGCEGIKVIYTPGHSPGSVCLLCKDDSGKSFMLTGDTLFENSVGRCDLWGGDSALLASSLAKLAKYDKDIVIYPGHGAPSTLGSALESAKYYVDF